MRLFLLLLISVLTVVYPLLVYYGLNYVSPALFGIVFLVAGLARFAVTKHKSEPLTVILLLLVGSYSVLLALSGKDWLLRLYPVVVSLGMSGVFAASLTREIPLIESFARAAGKTITANAKRYTRTLTAVWAVILLINGMVSLYLALFASLAAWALYCGLLSYVLMGTFFLLELLYRQYYIKRVGQ